MPYFGWLSEGFFGCLSTHLAGHTTWSNITAINHHTYVSYPCNIGTWRIEMYDYQITA